MPDSTTMKSIKPATRIRRAALPVLLVALAVAAIVMDLRYLRNGPARDHILQGVALQQKGRLAEAEQEWRTALRLDPSRREPYQLLGALYLRTDRPDAALPLLERLSQIAPTTEHTLCGLAEAYARTGQEDKALDTSRQAVLLEPNCARAHTLLGIQLGERHELITAVAELTTAEALAPNDPKIALSLAQAQLAASDFVGAEQTARNAITHDPGYARAWYMVGCARAALPPTRENRREAITAFQKALALQPNQSDALAELGMMRVRIGEYSQAIPSLETAWRQGVHTTELASSLTTAYRKVGNTKREQQMTALVQQINAPKKEEAR